MEFTSAFSPDLAGIASIKAGHTALACIDNERLGDDTTAICKRLTLELPANPPPILLFAESSPVAEWVRWSASGVADFLMKPVSTSELKLKALSLVYRMAMGTK